MPVSFDVPSLISPSDEQSIACGTLMWYLSPAHQATEEKHNEAPLTSRIDEETVRNAFRRTRKDIEQFALSRGFQLHDLHCTLLGMLLKTETGAVAVGQIGDGLIAGLHLGLGAHQLVEAPMPSEVGETFVFTQSDWEKYLAVRVYSPEEAAGIATFYLMTDGVTDDCTHPPPDDIF
ncbi:MAG: protein phosphatase 2C domain-containing protein [Armatimonadota bacterium]|nr:protein phosphatase 2C domain-containing protein [Armatimonadota bacterium]